MKIIAVDDEKIALQGLLSAIQQAAPNAEIYGFRYTREAIAHMESDPCDVAFLDIEMKGMNGVEVAEKLKAINPNVNIIFATGFGTYRDAAFDLHASGYLIKPITEANVKRELDNLRRPVSTPKRLQIRTFGNFEVLYNNTPLKFQYQKTKEMLAYLVDRKGARMTAKQICAILFSEDTDDTKNAAYLRQLVLDIKNTLKAVGAESVFCHETPSYRIDTSLLKCDYISYLETGKPEFYGEYMTQYSWAEETCAMLQFKK